MWCSLPPRRRPTHEQSLDCGRSSGDHVRTYPVRELDGEGPHTPGRALNQRSLPSRKACVIEERLPRCEGRDRDLRRLYEVERVRFGRYLCLAGKTILGLCALPVPVVEPVDSIAHGQVSDIGTERHDDTSELMARDDRETTIGACPGFPGPGPRKFG